MAKPRFNLTDKGLSLFIPDAGHEGEEPGPVLSTWRNPDAPVYDADIVALTMYLQHFIDNPQDSLMQAMKALNIQPRILADLCFQFREDKRVRLLFKEMGFKLSMWSQDGDVCLALRNEGAEDDEMPRLFSLCARYHDDLWVAGPFEETDKAK